jgi:hypothetical protein
MSKGYDVSMGYYVNAHYHPRMQTLILIAALATSDAPEYPPPDVIQRAKETCAAVTKTIREIRENGTTAYEVRVTEVRITMADKQIITCHDEGDAHEPHQRTDRQTESP